MSRLIQWFVENPIAANILMVLILFGGVLGMSSVGKEVFPNTDSGMIEISVVYPGAGPREMEELVTVRVEEAVADLLGIDELSSVSRQNITNITIKVQEGYDTQKLLTDVKSRVDSLNTLPTDIERPVIREIIFQQGVISLALYGSVSELALKRMAQQVRDEAALLPGVSLTEIDGARQEEISIELREQALRQYRLSFDEVTQAIRGSSINVPAGVIKTQQGNLQLQTRGQGYVREDFAKMVVRARPDGTRLLLDDIADIRDGFADESVIAKFNGYPAVFVELYVTGDKPDVLNTTAAVRDYAEQLRSVLPKGMNVDIWRDRSLIFKDRMNLLIKNAVGGLVLVFILLMLFLRPLLAFWVCAGIAVSFLGAFWLLPYLGVNLHMISLFAFLLILGIVVDDAIIVGESIYSSQQRGMRGNSAAAVGAHSVAKPVIFAVLSTMIFFAPMLSMPGHMGKMTYAIPVVVLLCLAFSLIESLLILPSHLSHMKPERPSRLGPFQRLELWRERFAHGLEVFAEKYYQPLFHKALNNHRIAIALFAVAFFLSVAVYVAGHIRTSFIPNVPSDYVTATIQLPEGVPFSTAEKVLARVEGAAKQLESDLSLRGANDDKGFVKHFQTWATETRVRVNLELEKAERRDVSTKQVAQRWRELVGALPEAESVDFGFTINRRGKDITLRLSFNRMDEQEQIRAIEAVREALSRYDGVYDIEDSFQSARTEIELVLRPFAEVLGVDLAAVARQVRQGFYGDEVQRIPRGKEDVKVMVRYSEGERRYQEQLNLMRIRTADGREIPLPAVAEVRYQPGYNAIEHFDRKRSITVSASLLPNSPSAQSIVADLIGRNRQQWKSLYPGFDISIYGGMKEQGDFMDSMVHFFLLALLSIFGLMAVAFRSYSQPFLILTAVPFGFMGAIIGHILMGREISMLSVLGFLACAGVVVNDNLVLVDRINALRHQGMATVQALQQAGRDRFRPIILTSLTTFIGLMPIMSEQSVQARFLIPMVISLAFGVLFATVVTLILVPCLYLSMEKQGQWLRDKLARLRSRWQQPAAEGEGG